MESKIAMPKKKKNKVGFTKLHFYFLVFGGLLLAVSSTFEYGEVDFLLGIMSASIFLTALSTERFTKKFEKKREKNPKNRGFIGAILGVLIGAIFSGLINAHFMIFSNGIVDEKSTGTIILSLLLGIITGAVTGYALNYITAKRGLEPLSCSDK